MGLGKILGVYRLPWLLHLGREGLMGLWLVCWCGGVSLPWLASCWD